MAAPSATGALSPPRRFSSAKPAERWRLSSRRGSPRRVFIWGAALFSAVGVVGERVPGLRSREKSRCTSLCRLDSGEAKGVGWGHETEGKQVIWLDATWVSLSSLLGGVHRVGCGGGVGHRWRARSARPPRQCRGLPRTRPRWPRPPSPPRALLLPLRTSRGATGGSNHWSRFFAPAMGSFSSNRRELARNCAEAVLLAFLCDI